jgi:hypothetical protein
MKIRGVELKVGEKYIFFNPSLFIHPFLGQDALSFFSNLILIYLV